MNTNFIDHVYLMFGNVRMIRYASMITMSLIVAAAIYRFRAYVQTMVWPTVLTLAVVSVMTPPLVVKEAVTRVYAPASRVSAGEHPNVVIIIVDGHIGLEGLAIFGERGQPVKKKILTDCTHQGFKVYGGALSDSDHTRISVPHVLFGDASSLKRTGSDWAVTDHSFFKKFSKIGSAINIYQSSYLLFAPKNPPQKQLTYAARSTRYLELSGFSETEKTIVLLGSFISFSKSDLLKKISSKLAPRQEKLKFLGSLFVDVLLGEVTKDMEQHPKNNLFLMHMLLPHGPYVYSSSGELKKPWEWVAGRGVSRTQDRQAAYLDQVLATHVKLNALFDAMKKAGVYDTSRIVVFGDHGSRLHWAGMSEEQKRLDDYSAYLAIKPAMGDGALTGEAYDAAPVSLRHVVGEYLKAIQA